MRSVTSKSKTITESDIFQWGEKHETMVVDKVLQLEKIARNWS